MVTDTMEAPLKKTGGITMLTDQATITALMGGTTEVEVAQVQL